MLNSTLHSFGIDLIVDVGANAGRYAMGVRSGGYKNRMVSFEPLTEAHALLTANPSEDALWAVYARCAVGNQDGEIELNVSGNSASSSILPMLVAHSDAVPESNYVSAERTKIMRLDSVFCSLPNRQGQAVA
jgi:FkbM family methyltransferase